MNILVLCTGNSCRSQMAQGWLKHIFPNNKVYSAGVEKHGINPYAVEVMSEVGIDISKNTSNLVEEYKHISFDFVLTVCDHAKESCPVFFGNCRVEHHNFKDPSKSNGKLNTNLEDYRFTRDEIRVFCESLNL